MLLWHTLSTYFRSRFQGRVQKIPLDAGACCPNRDGTLSRQGCVFCNAQGSGSGFMERGIDIGAQWDFWQAKYRNTDSARDFLAYFQSFSNTYGTLSHLRTLLDTVRSLPGNVGIAIGTRPDCVDEAKLDLLAACPLPEIWLELGLQSAHDRTLALINRQHTATQAEHAVRLAAERGLRVCGHLMAGLPGENKEDFLQTVRWAANLPLSGVKLHCCYVCHGSPLALWHAQGRYTPLSQEAYTHLLAEALPLLPARMVIHRLTGDPAPGELAAPQWTLHKRPLFTALYHHMRQHNLWQGCRNDAVDERPVWFGG